MIDVDQLLEIGSTLRRNALRTTLTAVGVFWGVFLLVVMVGFGNGLEDGVKSSMGTMTTNSFYIWGQRTSVPYRGQTPGRPIRLSLDDAVALEEAEGVRVVAPRISLGGRRATNPVTRGDKSGDFEIYGDTPARLVVNPVELEGRFINPLDMDQRRKVAVVGTTIVDLLFEPGEEPIGEAITIQGSEYMVVGVFRTDATGDSAEREAKTIHIPLTTFQKALNGNSPDVHYFAVLSDDDVKASVVEARTKDVLASRHRVAPDDKEAIGSFNADEEVRKLVALFTGISVLIYIVAGATLVAGLVGVSNIMMVSVRERTREIGIRKAIGATPRGVIFQVVAEAVVLASAAGYLGLVAGVGLLEAIGALMPVKREGAAAMFAAPTVGLSTALIAAVVVALGGGLAGLFPALNAARIRTVTALRDE